MPILRSALYNNQTIQPQTMEKRTLKELLVNLEKELRRMHYKEVTIKSYRGRWHHFVEYCESKGEEYYSESLAMQYVDEKCDYFRKKEQGELTQSNSYLFRTIRMIGDFSCHGVVPRRYALSLSPINEEQNLALLDNFARHRTELGFAKSSSDGYKKGAQKLMVYLEAHSMKISDITPELLSEFVKSLMGYSPKMVEYIFCALKAFLDYCAEQGLINEGMSKALPPVKVYSQTQLPSTWDTEDIMKVLAQIDRGSPNGKRDYAILLLAINLGMRIIDIKHLRMSNLHWRTKEIVFNQSKTKEEARLPMTKTVGWALIDYIKDGRPDVNDDHVFLTHKPPYGPLADSNHMHNTITKYIEKAKLCLMEQHHCGMHSLRHSLACTLLENDTPIGEISEVLGHKDTESTVAYLRSSLSRLSECSLDPEDYEDGKK